MGYREKAMERQVIIAQVEGGRMGVGEAAGQLGISRTQAWRMVKRYREGGGSLRALQYRRTHPAWNRKGEGIRKEVVRLKLEQRGRSNPYIAQLVREASGERISPATVRRILIATGVYHPAKQGRRPAQRFEAERFGELVQVDTTSGNWLCGGRRVHLMLALDDHSRAILAFRLSLSDDTANNLMLLRDLLTRWGRPRAMLTDNDSKFAYLLKKTYYRTTDGIYDYRTHPEDVETNISRALRELGIAHIRHSPGNARCKGKIEKLFDLIQKRFFAEHQGEFESLAPMAQALGKWVEWYNHHWVNRNTGTTPNQRLKPSSFQRLRKSQPLQDILCQRLNRTVQTDHTFSLDGVTYQLSLKGPSLVGKKVTVNLLKGETVRVLFNGRLVGQLPWIEPPARHKDYSYLDPLRQALALDA